MSFRRRQLLQILSYAFGSSFILPRNEFVMAAQIPAQPQSTRQASLGDDPDHSFPRGRPHREVSFRRRRCSLSFMISLKSTTGRISIGPSPYLKPGCCETS